MPETQTPTFVAQTARDRGIWHNGFSDQLDDSTGDIRYMLSLVATAQLKLDDAGQMPRENYLADLAMGQRQAIELSYRIGADHLNIGLNTHFGGKLVRASASHSPYALGNASITILGPFDEDIEKLRKQWLHWVKGNHQKIRLLRQAIDKDAERMGLAEADRFLRIMESIATASRSFGNRNDVKTPILPRSCSSWRRTAIRPCLRVTGLVKTS